MDTQILKKNRVPIIAVTSSIHSPLGKLADVVLFTSNLEKKKDKFGTFASTASIDYVLNMLYAQCFVENFDLSFNTRTKNEQLLSVPGNPFSSDED